MLIRVIKPFLVRGQRQEPGSVVDLPDHVAREILWMGKAERVSDVPAEPQPSAPVADDCSAQETEPAEPADPAPAATPVRRGRSKRVVP